MPSCWNESRRLGEEESELPKRKVLCCVEAEESGILYPTHILEFPMLRSWLSLFALIAAAGCSPKGATVTEAPLPKYDADEIAKAALSEFDRNQNGSIEGTELNACPALKGALAEFDTNGNKQLTAEEIRTRVEAYGSGSTGTVQVSCEVRLDRQPLDGATITFTPEKCMGSSLKTGVGKTDADGRCAEYLLDGKTYRGLAPGLYRIQITKDGVSIPAKFNTQTTLGKEIFHNPRAGMVFVALDVSSR